MADIWINYSTQGRTVQGSVWDCNKKHLERRLQEYDKQLYIKWNPYKNGGIGIWEIRRRPDNKTLVYQGTLNGYSYFEPKYVELHMVHHVMDVPILRYGLVDKIKAMDTWAHKNFLDTLETKANEMEASQRKGWRDDMLYQLKQDKKYLAAYKEAVLNGFSPTAFFNGIYEQDHENSVYNQKLPR